MTPARTPPTPIRQAPNGYYPKGSGPLSYSGNSMSMNSSDPNMLSQSGKFGRSNSGRNMVEMQQQQQQAPNFGGIGGAGWWGVNLEETSQFGKTHAGAGGGGYNMHDNLNDTASFGRSIGIDRSGGRMGSSS